MKCVQNEQGISIQRQWSMVAWASFWEVVDDLNVLHIITTCRRSCGKVMFLQVSVILFTVPAPGGSQEGTWSWGVPGPGGFWFWGCLVLGVPGPGSAWSWGCLVLGACSQGRGCLVETPQTATAAGSTHPSGMHSSLIGKLYR